MNILERLAAIVAAGLLSYSAAKGQTAPDYDAAARHADRAIKAYEDLQREQMADLAEKSMNAALINLHICKPMHDQTSLTRRQYIASVVKGRGKQKAVAKRCAEQELWYASICRPRDGLDGNGDPVTFIEPSCPTKWEEWPAPPPVMSREYYQRQADIWALYQ